MENECIGCGCTDSRACASGNEPCHWLEVDEAMGLGVCSNCPSHVEELRQRQANLAEFAKEEMSSGASAE
ncbi:MAG: hypothetical protein CBD27_08665 [Rhodospirillaceae bacterium TMED167]|nr:MAG: hypothetical protein CBD27_08665 [Rhodospirillaceae bacterium TMED167]